MVEVVEDGGVVEVVVDDGGVVVVVEPIGRVVEVVEEVELEDVGSVSVPVPGWVLGGGLPT